MVMADSSEEEIQVVLFFLIMYISEVTRVGKLFKKFIRVEKVELSENKVIISKLW